MNRLLADILGFLNGVVAIVLVLVGGMVGFQSGSIPGGVGMFGGFQSESTPVGLLWGLLVGAGFAVIICGFIALLVDIRNLLVELRDK